MNEINAFYEFYAIKEIYEIYEIYASANELNAEIWSHAGQPCSGAEGTG
jgi:hypothetical protein